MKTSYAHLEYIFSKLDLEDLKLLLDVINDISAIQYKQYTEEIVEDLIFKNTNGFKEGE